jgi:hypothetical protein
MRCLIVFNPLPSVTFLVPPTAPLAWKFFFAAAFTLALGLTISSPLNKLNVVSIY